MESSFRLITRKSSTVSWSYPRQWHIPWHNSSVSLTSRALLFETHHRCTYGTEINISPISFSSGCKLRGICLEHNHLDLDYQKNSYIVVLARPFHSLRLREMEKREHLSVYPFCGTVYSSCVFEHLWSSKVLSSNRCSLPPSTDLHSAFSENSGLA